ncbi:mannose-binding protein C-like isoform X2 [Mytilus californianus]|nr:mannose-binding protein C-like isoform X2 [Mytilus californianus]
MALRATSPVRSSTGTTTSRLISPTFNPASNYCVRFWYTMYGKDVKTLNVYAQVHGGLGYPVLTHTGNVDNQWHMAEISLNKEYTADMFQVVFEATHDAYHTHRYSSSSGRYYYDNHNQNGNIAVDDVYVYNTTCQNVPKYPSGSFMRTAGSKTSYYTFHGKATTWYDAVETCKKENIHSNLASVVDAAEQDYLVKLIQSDVSLTAAGQKGFFINGNDYDSENKYEWTASGYPESFNYTNWHVGQPNNVGDNQDCLLMQYPESNYEWGDVSCSEKHPFICETVL